MARSPRRRKSDGLYNKSVYKQSELYASKELKILNNSSSKGYAVNIPKASPDTSKSWNAALLAPFGAYVKLWVTEIEMNFSLHGVTAQSRYRKQFFPRSFNQPTISVSGTMPNQKEYNRLAAFIRECHFEAVTGNQNLYDLKDQQTAKQKRGSSASLQTVTLLVKNAGPEGDKNIPRNIKGRHKALQFDGYIKLIKAGATQFNFAPDFNFQFIPASSQLTGSIGIYEDMMDEGSEILAWMDIFKKYGFAKETVKDNPQKSNVKPVK